MFRLSIEKYEPMIRDTSCYAATKTVDCWQRSKLRGKNQNLMVQRERDFLLAEIDRLWEEKCQLQDKEKQLREKELKLLDIKMRRGIPANWLAYLLGTLFLIALCTD